MESEKLSDAEIALMDAQKSIIEILLYANIAQPKTFDKLFTNCTVLIIMAFFRHLHTSTEVGHGKRSGNAI